MIVLPQSSLTRLDAVHPDLLAVVLLAAERSSLGFIVTEGARSVEKQRTLVAKRASRTMHSRHVAEMNECGMPCAVDLAAWLDGDLDGVPEEGELRWDGSLYFELAYAMQAAAHTLRADVVWGGCWQSLLRAAHLEDAQAAYVARKRAKGERPFIDGPHFELSKERYP